MIQWLAYATKRLDAGLMPRPRVWPGRKIRIAHARKLNPKPDRNRHDLQKTNCTKLPHLEVRSIRFSKFRVVGNTAFNRVSIKPSAKDVEPEIKRRHPVCKRDRMRQMRSRLHADMILCAGSTSVSVLLCRCAVPQQPFRFHLVDRLPKQYGADPRVGETGARADVVQCDQHWVPRIAG